MDQLNLTHFEGAANTAYLAQSRVPAVIACNVILLSIVSIAVAVRLYVRYRYYRIRSDDILCIISWMFTFALCFISMWMTRYGYGRHFELIAGQPSTITMFLKVSLNSAALTSVDITSLYL
jgi:hypothetical protein